jgi:hypothetical protein
MTESFLHYVWKNKIFRFLDLKTTDDEDLKIIHPGFPHQDAGPDFKQAIIKIGAITWAGDVEIHVNSSDWIKHRHQLDPKYQSVALHVVYNNDCIINRSDREHISTLELKSYIPIKVIEEYQKLSLSDNLLPCKTEVKNFPALQFSSFLSGIAVDRLLGKQNSIFEILRNCSGDWNETFFRLLGVNFGFKTNAPAFDLLGKSIPYKILCNHANNRLQLYSIIFGQAGMLEKELDDDYYIQLQDEYRFLRYKYDLIPIHKKNWNYLRLRPSNFPCIRLAQFSEIIYNTSDVLNKYLFTGEFDSLLKNFKKEPHEYWKTHYHFGKCTAEHPVNLGKKTENLIFINTLIPLLFAFGTFSGEEKIQEKAIGLLENIDFEENRTTKCYKSAGFPAGNALYSQAILELHQHYCLKKKCLDCALGSFIIKK